MRCCTNLIAVIFVVLAAVLLQPTGLGNAQTYECRVNAPSGLNVRTGPGTNYSDIGGLPYNFRIQPLEQSGSWYRIEYRGGTGWVAAYWVSGDCDIVPSKVSLPNSLIISDTLKYVCYAIGFFVLLSLVLSAIGAMLEQLESSPSISTYSSYTPDHTLGHSSSTGFDYPDYTPNWQQDIHTLAEGMKCDTRYSSDDQTPAWQRDIHRIACGIGAKSEPYSQDDMRSTWERDLHAAAVTSARNSGTKEEPWSFDDGRSQYERDLRTLVRASGAKEKQYSWDDQTPQWQRDLATLAEHKKSETKKRK